MLRLSATTCHGFVRSPARPVRHHTITTSTNLANLSSGSGGSLRGRSSRSDAEPAAQNTQPSHLLLPALVVEACPVIADYARPIRDAADLVAAGLFLRASLGAHPSVWTEAMEGLGAIRAATVVIYVLQLYEDDVRNSIRNAGGYFQSMVRLIKSGKIDLQAELLTLRRHKHSPIGGEVCRSPFRQTLIHADALWKVGWDLVVARCPRGVHGRLRLGTPFGRRQLTLVRAAS
jgi:hypothetical protein